VLVAAFLDSYNNVVKAVRNYRPQTVRGGLGTGGRLGVQGGSTPASQEVGAGGGAAPAAPAATTTKPGTTTTRKPATTSGTTGTK